MKLLFRSLFLLLFLCPVLDPSVSAQTAGPSATNKAKILSYIHTNWNTLSRSMSSCTSVVDPKVTSVPVLYLPDEMAVPPSVSAMEKNCQVEVRNLPRKITHMGDLSPSDLPEEGLLYLPHPYVVP